MTLTIRQLSTLLLCIPLITALVWFLLPGKSAITHYDTATVQFGDIEDIVLTTGKLDASERINVGAQVTGQVKLLAVKVGDSVTKGQLIADIDDLQQRNNLHIAEARYSENIATRASKEAQLKLAESRYKRQRNMLLENAASRDEFEYAEAQLISARTEIKLLQSQIFQAQTDVEKAKQELSYTRVTAPIDGTVIAVTTKQGQTVNAAQSAPTIVKIAKLDVMTIRIKISEADITRVYPGQKARFTILSEPEHHYNAVLRMVEPAADSILEEENSGNNSAGGNASVYFSGLLDVPNPGNHLKLAMTAQVSLLVEEKKHVLLIPVTTVTPEPDGTKTVQVLNKEGIPEKRTITTGSSDSANTQILSGLQEGEQVVIPENNLLQTGDPDY